MGTTQTANPPSFETVWAALQEVAKRQEETDRQMKERAERLDKQLGKLGNRMGEIIEYMIAPNLREKFRELGLNFPQANQNTNVSDYDNNIFLEIDVKL
jgi:predicted transcriptional regulator